MGKDLLECSQARHNLRDTGRSTPLPSPGTAAVGLGKQQVGVLEVRKDCKDTQTSSRIAIELDSSYNRRRNVLFRLGTTDDRAPRLEPARARSEHRVYHFQLGNPSIGCKRESSCPWQSKKGCMLVDSLSNKTRQRKSSLRDTLHNLRNNCCC
jgi:hypothetical protein